MRGSLQRIYLHFTVFSQNFFRTAEDQLISLGLIATAVSIHRFNNLLRPVDFFEQVQITGHPEDILPQPLRCRRTASPQRRPAPLRRKSAEAN